MLESTIALLGGLCLSALTLLMGACIAGSIVAAPTSGQPGKHTIVSKYEKMKMFGFGLK